MKIHENYPKQKGIPSIWLRLKALFLDYAIILIWMAFIGLISSLLYLAAGGYPDYLGTLGPFGAQILFFFVLTFPAGLYLYVTESSTRHATFGKRKAGLKVTKTDGGELTKKNILMRTVVKLLPWEIAHTFAWQMQYVFYRNGYDSDVPVWIFIGLQLATVLAVIYVATIAIRRDGRGPHDVAAGTLVVYR